MNSQTPNSEPETLDAPSTFGGRRPSSCSFPETALEMKELFQVCRNIVIRLYPPGAQRNQIRQTLRVTEIRAQTWLSNQLNRIEAFDPSI